MGRARAEERSDVGSNAKGCLGILGAMVAMTASILVCVALSEPTFDRWGPYLDSVGGWERAGLGVGVGAGAALPLLLARIRPLRRLLTWPLVFYGFTAWVYLSTLWIGGRRSSLGYDARQFRSEADWYIATSVLAFHLAVPLVLWLALRDVRPDDEAAPAVPGMVSPGRRAPTRPARSPERRAVGSDPALHRAMHRAVHADVWLFDLPDGDFVDLEDGARYGGPYDPADCSALLLRWFDAGLVELRQDRDPSAEALTAPSVHLEPPAADLPLIPAPTARALLADPLRWTDAIPEGFAVPVPTARGASTPADRWP